MNKNLFSIILMIVFFAGLFAAFTAVVNAKSLNLQSAKNQKILVILRNDAKLDASKAEILKLSKIKIIKITDRDKEWSKMVNKMDLPKMENPFKNELIIKVNKNANADEIFNKIKGMDFVENVEYISGKGCTK